MTLGKQPKVRTAGKPPPGSSASSTIRLLSWLQARKLPASSNLHWAWSQGEHHAVGSQWLCQDALWGHSKLQDNPWLEASQLLKVYLILCSNLVLLHSSFCPVALLVSEQSKIWGNWEAVCEKKQIKTGHAAACDSGVPFRSSWGIPGNSDGNKVWEQWGVGEAWQESELRKSREYVNRQPLMSPKDLLK